MEDSLQRAFEISPVEEVPREEVSILDDIESRRYKRGFNDGVTKRAPTEASRAYLNGYLVGKKTRQSGQAQPDVCPRCGK